jgi:hypothetical protein
MMHLRGNWKDQPNPASLFLTTICGISIETSVNLPKQPVGQPIEAK